WQALTDPNVTARYWYGYRVAADGKAGGPMTATDPAGQEVHHYVILVRDPPWRLSYAWRPLYDEYKHERPSRVTIDITPLKDQVRLTVVHDDFDEGSVVLEKIKGGWPAVLSSLKTYLETGRALSAPDQNSASAAEVHA